MAVSHPLGLNDPANVLVVPTPLTQILPKEFAVLDAFAEMAVEMVWTRTYDSLDGRRLVAHL